MSNPAFIVDGFTEKLIVQRICPGRPINRTDLNGKAVTIQAIAKRIAALIRLLGNRYYPIIILIDKEDRHEPFEIIAEKLDTFLKQEDINVQYVIGVADRMLENWIIADWNSLNSDEEKPENTDCCNGASYIKRVHGSYSKTTDGVELFLKADQSIIYRHSPSFRHFVDGLNNINCAFLNFNKEL